LLVLVFRIVSRAQNRLKKEGKKRTRERKKGKRREVELPMSDLREKEEWRKKD